MSSVPQWRCVKFKPTSRYFTSRWRQVGLETTKSIVTYHLLLSVQILFVDLGYPHVLPWSSIAWVTLVLGTHANKLIVKFEDECMTQFSSMKEEAK